MTVASVRKPLYLFAIVSFQISMSIIKSPRSVLPKAAVFRRASPCRQACFARTSCWTRAVPTWRKISSAPSTGPTAAGSKWRLTALPRASDTSGPCPGRYRGSLWGLLRSVTVRLLGHDNSSTFHFTWLTKVFYQHCYQHFELIPRCVIDIRVLYLHNLT